jgi:hypothetical protein
VGLFTDHKDNVGNGFAADRGITEYATQESIIEIADKRRGVSAKCQAVSPDKPLGVTQKDNKALANPSKSTLFFFVYILGPSPPRVKALST